MGEENNNNQVGGQWSCCNDEQTLFILLYIAFAAVTFVLGHSLLLKPARLITVFLHEFSHALACWLTGGDVVQLQVFENEGGVTRYIGGSRCCVIPAGYLGASFTAMIFVILSGGRRTATFAAAAFTFSLLLALCYSPNRVMIYLCLSYAVITLSFIFIEWYYYTPILQYVILFYGVFSGMYAITDIYDDTVVRSVEGSDAYACAKEVWQCCAPRCIGIQWALVAIVFQLFGIWIALVEMSEECEDLGWFECLHLKIDLGDLDLGERHWDFDGFWDQGP
jgi:hypothetical protein